MNINFFYTNKAMVKSLGLGPAALFGYLTVITNLPSGTCTASYDTIGEDFGVNRKTVMRWMNKLHTNNYIVRERVEGATYDITIPEDVKVSLEFNIKKPRKKANVPEVIDLIRGLYGRYPKKETWPRIEEQCEGKTLEQIAEVHAIWCKQINQTTKKPYSPTNPAWLNWVENGVPMAVKSEGPVSMKVTKVAQEIVEATEFTPQDDGGTF